MAPRNKKDSEDPQTPQMQISLEQFTRTRDSVIVSLSNVQRGLAHVQNGLNDLMTAYIKHTASVLAGEDGALEALQLPESIADTANAAIAAATCTTFTANNVAAAVSQPTAATAPAPETGKKLKRKREKKVKDPNAPKRPLTAAFLYAQAARPVVKGDLEAELAPGQKLEPNAVNFEINKRWNEMSEEEKESWKASYRSSMEKFKEDWAAYQATKGDAVPEVPHDDEEVSDEAEAGALDSDAGSESDDEEAVEPSPKAPTPKLTNGKTPRPNKRQKTAATPQVNGTAPVAIAPAHSRPSNPTPVPLPAGTRLATQIPTPSSNAEVAPAPAKSAKEKKGKKEKPVAPQLIAPAPAAGKESSPDDTKKSKKSGRATRNAEVDGESQEKENKPAKKRDRSKRKSEAAAA